MEREGEQPGRPEDVRVLSWNLWCHLLVGGAGASERLAQFATVVEQLKPDVVCAQEMFEGRALVVSVTTWLTQLCATMEVLGFATVRSRATVPWLYGQDSGLVSFVRQRRIVSQEAVVFRRSSEWVCNKGKLALEVLLCGCKLTIGSQKATSASNAMTGSPSSIAIWTRRATPRWRKCSSCARR